MKEENIFAVIVTDLTIYGRMEGSDTTQNIFGINTSAISIASGGYSTDLTMPDLKTMSYIS